MAFSSRTLWQDDPNPPSELLLHNYADPFVMMAWAARIVGPTTVGTCVTDAIRRMPASLVQTIMTLDHVAAGTVILGLGAGEGANYRPYGWDIPSPTERLEDASRQIRKLLDDPGPNEEGAVLAIRPSHGSVGPQLWLAAHGTRGFKLVGECCDGWLPLALDVDSWLAGRDLIRAAAIANGRLPSTITMGLSADVVVRDTHREADNLLRHPAVRMACLLLPPSVFARSGIVHPLGSKILSSIVPTRDGQTLLQACISLPDNFVHDHIIHGTPQEVADGILQYEGLGHVRLSDLSGIVASGGGAERLLEIVHRLHLATPQIVDA